MGFVVSMQLTLSFSEETWSKFIVMQLFIWESGYFSLIRSTLCNYGI